MKETSATPTRDQHGAARRRFPRFAVPPLRVSSLPARVMDVSRGGLSMTLYSSVKPGDRLNLLLTDALVYWTQELEAEVVWADHGRVGMRWIGLSEDQERWLDDRFQAWQKEREAGTDEPLDVIRWSV